MGKAEPRTSAATGRGTETATERAPTAADRGGELELSVVMPCLNEADTLERCILKARQALADHAIRGEVVVADNGSSDGSQAIAERAGARVVHVVERGYGAALMGGIAAARGRFVLMGDADDSYDFLELPRFVERLRGGADLVQGCRRPVGGGRILPGAMPFLHRWLGNPLLTWLVRRMFRAPVHDAYCGMRAFSRACYERLRLRCTGMEFATEMIVKASLCGERIEEIPITLHPDGRRSHAPHLRTFRDGWRTVRFFLMSSPRWLFLIPGLALVASGGLIYLLAMPGVSLAGARLDAHSLLVGSLAILVGYQSILFAIAAKTFAVAEGWVPPDPRLERFLARADLERGLLLGLVGFACGLALIGVAFARWRAAGFGDLDYAQTMRWVIPGVTLAALGFQTLLSSFLVSILGMRRR